jgi:anti-anti-sigma factor
MSTLPLRSAVDADDDGAGVISLRGDIDVVNASGVEEVIGAALNVGESNVVLDLSGVTFMDASGLRALLVCQRAANQAGGSLSLRSPSRSVLDLLLLTGLDTAFHLEG